MKELIFVLFLVSGILKAFILYFNISSPVDLTMVTMLAMTTLLIVEVHSNNYQLMMNSQSKYAMATILLLFSLIIFSLLYTTSESYAIEKTLRFFTVILAFFYPILSQSFSPFKFFRWFVLIMLVLSIVYLPLYLESYSLYTTSYNEFREEGTITSVLYDSYLIMGYLIGIALIINIFTQLFSTLQKHLITAFLLLVLLLTGARGPLIFFFIVIVIYPFFSQLPMKDKILSKLLTLFFILIVTAISIINNPHYSDLLERTSKRLASLVLISDDASANDRLIQANFVMGKMTNKKLLRGYGFGSYGIEKTGVDQRYYPHNLVLEIFFELGFLGLLLYIALTILVIITLLRKNEFVLWALFIYLFLNSLKSLSFVDSRVFFGFLAVFLLHKQYISLSDFYRNRIK